MRHGINYSLAVFSFLCIPLIALADVWVPPWGESLYDSTLITVTYSDTSIDVTIQTKMAARKFVSDDYLLTWTREDSGGFILPDQSEFTFSDTITSLHDDDPYSAQMEGLSRCQLEDSVFFSMVTTTHYSVGEDIPTPQFITYEQILSAHTDDPAWMDWNIPFEDEVAWFVRVVSNREVTAWGDDVRTGSNLTFSSRMGWRLSFVCGVFLTESSAFSDHVIDSVNYGLTPEVRMATPGIILDEDVRIYISYAGDGAWHYMQHADIKLEPELARSLSPMYLWYPNDETEVSVRLQGFKLRGIWGQDIEQWQDDSAEVHIVHNDEQNGFFIKIPSLECEYQTPNDYWHWTDVRLQVDIDQELNGGESTRFILITAPLDYSRINFSITNGWATGFVRCENPFDDILYNRARTNLTMRGICGEPGVAQVWWGPVGVKEERAAFPAEFSITSIAPNPFNSMTTIRYELPTTADVLMNVVDMSGRIVHEELIGGEAGENSISLDAASLPAGIYLVQLEASGVVERVKIVLVR